MLQIKETGFVPPIGVFVSSEGAFVSCPFVSSAFSSSAALSLVGKNDLSIFGFVCFVFFLIFLALVLMLSDSWSLRL